MDVTELILFQHHEQRRTFALLDDLGLDDADGLSAVWMRLTALLEVHTEAEERFFYARLLAVGYGGRGARNPRAAEDAVKDHNSIRDAIAEAGRHRVGTHEWWSAVTQVRITNSDLVAEEEREDLADFRRRESLDTRHQAGKEFIAFESQDAGGVAAEGKEPRNYASDPSWGW